MHRDERPALQTRTEAARAFESVADAIVYRWKTERDTWVSASEIEHARAYLAGIGVATLSLPDGSFAVEGEKQSTVGAAHLVLLGLKHLQASRKSRSRF
jgi:hypothetical protein